MKLAKENLSYILGIKVKKMRTERGLSLKELSELTKLSVSYLSEIEKGKKYPRPEKILLLTEVLQISFESLVSAKVDKELKPLKEIMDSTIFREFPFEIFGISQRDILDLITNAPQKASAFLKTFVDISRIYDVRVEHIFYAALRSYQKMNKNYFPELEKSVEIFILENRCEISTRISLKKYKNRLQLKYGYKIIEKSLEEYPELSKYRSLFIDGNEPKLLLNKKLLPSQKAFIIAKEIGYNYLKIERPQLTSNSIKISSFDQVLNNFKAAYFAGALLINKNLLKEELNKFFAQKKWNGKNFLAIINRFNATPEMFVYRFGHLLYDLFGIEEFHYLRFNNKVGSERFDLMKELNMSPVIAPHSIGLNEHYCRRWLSIDLLNQLAKEQKKGKAKSSLIDVSRAKFIETDAEFFTISIARPLLLSSDTNSSMIVGFLINDKFKKTVKFWDDPQIKDSLINETCERCGLSKSECSERIAPATIYKKLKDQKLEKDALIKLLGEYKE